MTQLNEIKIMNDTMIVYLKKMGVNYQRNEIINNIFADDACFFKMPKEDALLILDTVGVKDNIEEIYSDLVSRDIYYDLYQKGKINENDKELVIKYEIYDSANLFKTKNTAQMNFENTNKDASIINVTKRNFFQRLFDKIKSLFTKK